MNEDILPRHTVALDKLKEGVRYAQQEMEKHPAGSPERIRWQKMKQGYANTIIKNFGYDALPESKTPKTAYQKMRIAQAKINAASTDEQLKQAKKEFDAALKELRAKKSPKTESAVEMVARLLE